MMLPPHDNGLSILRNGFVVHFVNRRCSPQRSNARPIAAASPVPVGAIQGTLAAYPGLALPGTAYAHVCDALYSGQVCNAILCRSSLLYVVLLLNPSCALSVASCPANADGEPNCVCNSGMNDASCIHVA